MPGKNQGDRFGFDRRSILKAAASAGIGSAALAGQSTAVNGSDEPDLLDGSEVSSDAAAIFRNQETRRLHRRLIERGYRPNRPNAVGVTVPTGKMDFRDLDVDVETFESLSPRSIFLPYKRDQDDSIAFLNALIVDNETRGPPRVPASAWALIGTPDPESDAVSVEIVAFESSSGHLATQQSDQQAGGAPREVTTIESFEVGATDGVSTQAIPTETCLAIVIPLCRRYGTSVSYSTCARLCLRTVNPIVGASCSAFCVGLVAVIQRYGCGTSASVLCAAV